jgi:putative NIF3 family GTP cyclohydrolase 1 type 2
LSAHAQYPQQGLGVIGDLPEAIAFVDLLSQLKSSLSIQQLRYTEPAHPMVQRIALCGGSGSSLIGEAMSQGADVYVTADCKYHDMQLSLGQMAIVDIDHWVSEQFVRDVFADMLQEHVPVYIAKQDHTHIHIF